MLVGMLPDAVSIQVQGTPNPNAVKFTLNRVIATQGKTYRSGSETDADWAREILQIAGVTQVFAVNNFVSVSKSADADWDALVPQVQRVLSQSFSSS